MSGPFPSNPSREPVQEADPDNTLATLQHRVARLERLAADRASRLGSEMLDHYETKQRLQAIETSIVWRLSAPLRLAGARFPGLARALRLGMRLAWWTVSLQLPRHYRAWRDAKRRGARVALISRPDGVPPPRAQDIRLPQSSTPDVSIIIATYGKLEITLACLHSLQAHAPRCGIEVILVDDAYDGPEDMASLREIAGLRVIRNEVNMGFLRSCNRAAFGAQGRYLMMLNNDTEIEPEAIDALVDLLDARPDAGMAGSKLLFSDGVLQEAGGILWTDASGWNYGRGDDPARSEYNYVREVDYCSGASILIRRSCFERLGLFDERFAPAYYEDTDLALRMRAIGLKVLYEPRSVVMHHEGVSHGTDLKQGVKAHQAVNQTLLLERWGATLARENFASGEHVLRARDRARSRIVILIIDHYVPEPDRDAGSRSLMGIIDSLSDAGWLIKFWPHNRMSKPEYTARLERRGIEVIDGRWPGQLDDWMRENGSDLDHILVSRPDVAKDVLHQIVRHTSAILSFYGVDLHFARMRLQAERGGSNSLLAQAVAMEKLERRLWSQFDLILYPSEEEAAVVRLMAPDRLVRAIVPFHFATVPPRAAPSERKLLFVAGFAHPPNVDAALFLVHDILPRLREIVGPVQLTLAGSNPTSEVKALAGTDVQVTGYVTDDRLAELYSQSRAAVVPLRFGAGVKGKVVEALCQALPLVTTSIGAQGIAGLAELVPVHDDAPGIAAALARLLRDDAAWLAQSTVQIAYARQNFSREAMRASVLDAFAVV